MSVLFPGRSVLVGFAVYVFTKFIFFAALPSTVLVTLKVPSPLSVTVTATTYFVSSNSIPVVPPTAFSITA